MALNIKNPEVERLAADLAEMTGESKTETIRQALLERAARVQVAVTDGARSARTRSFLEREVWARVPKAQRGKAPTKAEREFILGLGREGV